MVVENIWHMRGVREMWRFSGQLGGGGAEGHLASKSPPIASVELGTHESRFVVVERR
jgi:hypothetical protein